jgi:hypothetical protein
MSIGLMYEKSYCLPLTPQKYNEFMVAAIPQIWYFYPLRDFLSIARQKTGWRDYSM